MKAILIVVPISLYGSGGVFNFGVFVPHQGPRRYVVGVEFEGTLEVQHRFLVIGSYAVVVS